MVIYQILVILFIENQLLKFIFRDIMELIIMVNLKKICYIKDKI